MKMTRTTIDTTVGNHIKDLLEQNPELYYREGAFREACHDMGQKTEVEFWSKNLTPVSSVEDMLNAVPDDLRPHFLTLYIHHFARELVV
jgi:hypothetical protein